MPGGVAVDGEGVAVVGRHHDEGVLRAGHGLRHGHRLLHLHRLLQCLLRLVAVVTQVDQSSWRAGKEVAQVVNR